MILLACLPRSDWLLTFAPLFYRYLSAFHASRRTPVPKKPYNPILGEIFRCCYYLGPTPGSCASSVIGSGALEAADSEEEADIPGEFQEAEMARRGPIPYASDDCVVFLAEQVH